MTLPHLTTALGQLLGAGDLASARQLIMTLYYEPLVAYVRKIPWTVEIRRSPEYDGDDGGGEGEGANFGPALENKRKQVKWHVMGSPVCNFSSVVIFPFDSRSKTCTLIQEVSSCCACACIHMYIYIYICVRV